MDDDTALLFSIPHIIVNTLFLILIVVVTRTFIEKYKSSGKGKKPSKQLFGSILFFNGVTFASVFGLLFMDLLKIPSFLSHDSVDSIEKANEFLHVHDVYHSFFVLFYVQSQKLSRTTVRFYTVAFGIALVLFFLVPILHAVDLDISIWTWCASTFCFYNITFMVSLNTLFIYKLWGIHQRCLQNDVFDEEILKMIVKTSLLAFICIGITMSSCIFLILRFSFQIENAVIDTIGEVLISVDIYTNFVFVVMSFKYFEKYYHAMFGKLEAMMMSALSPKKAEKIIKQIQLSEIDSTTITSKESAEESTSKISATPSA